MKVPQLTQAEVRDRARGLLLGLAGAEAAAGASNLARMALALAEVALADGELAPARLLDSWAAIQDQLALPPGSATAAALRLYRDGFPAEDLSQAVARILPPGSGEGPLARALPLALPWRDQPGRLKVLAGRSASCTHADAYSRLGTVAACLLARDLLSRELEDSLARVGQALREESPPGLSACLRQPRAGDPPEAPPGAASALAWSVYALSTESSLPELVRSLRDRGAATLALAGGLAGAAWGGGSIPEAMLAALDPSLRAALEATALRLAEAMPEPAAPAANAPDDGRGLV
ncbi:MAG: ADP-ribosylglycohydrolase family protein [Candidatus Dormibacteria bacterium]